MNAPERQGFPVAILWVLVALTLGWGFNWPMIKLALSEPPVFSFRSVCLAGGAAGTVLMKRYPVDLPVTSLTAGQLLIGGLPIYAGVLAFDLHSLQPLTLWPAVALATVMLPPGLAAGCLGSRNNPGKNESRGIRSPRSELAISWRMPSIHAKASMPVSLRPMMS